MQKFGVFQCRFNRCFILVENFSIPPKHWVIMALVVNMWFKSDLAGRTELLLIIWQNMETH